MTPSPRELIREWRLEHGLTQDECDRLAGMPSGVWCKIENGRAIGRVNANRIVKLTGGDPGDYRQVGPPRRDEFVELRHRVIALEQHVAELAAELAFLRDRRP
jgi:hypothetical protein